MTIIITIIIITIKIIITIIIITTIVIIILKFDHRATKNGETGRLSS